MGDRYRASLPIAAIVPTLILKDWLCHHYGWPEVKAFVVSLSLMLVIAGSARLYLHLRKSQKAL